MTIEAVEPSDSPYWRFVSVEVNRAGKRGVLLVRLAGVIIMRAPVVLEGQELRMRGATITPGGWATDKTLERINTKGVELWRLRSARRLRVRIRFAGES